MYTCKYRLLPSLVEQVLYGLQTRGTEPHIVYQQQEGQEQEDDQELGVDKEVDKEEIRK